MTTAAHFSTVSIATGASATYTALDGAMNITISDSVEMLDITDFSDSNLRRRIAGLRDISVSIDGDLQEADVGWTKLRACYVAGTAVVVRYILDGQASATTAGLTMSLLCESLERSASVDGKVEISASFVHEGTFDPIVIGGLI